MRVRCYLSELRGGRSLRSVAAEVGVNPGMLSRIEQGVAFPKDTEIPKLVPVYGSVDRWYPPLVLLSIESDDTTLHEIRREQAEAYIRERNHAS